MTSAELLQLCEELKIHLWVEESRLRFRAQKGVLTNELREQISRHREELICHLRRSKPAVVELSYGQRALWFQHQLAPQSAAYNLGFSARVVSPFDPELFRAAVEQLVERHSILNSVYRISDGEPHLDFSGSLTPLFVQHDAAGLSEAELSDAVLRYNREPFDLENGPIVRVHIFARSDSDHVLLLGVPHIACDGWSMGLLIQDLRSFCEALASRRPADLPLIRCRYTDFIEDQRAVVASSEGDRLKDYWTKQLAEIPVLDLPLDRPRLPARSYEGATYFFDIGDDLYRKVKALAQSEDTTLYTVLLSALQVLLMRYSGQENVPVGTPVAGRNRSEYEQVVGLFINQVVMRGDLSGNPTFREFLERNRRTIISALEHQAFPFPLIVQSIQAFRDPGRHPIFQVLFNLLRQSSLGSIHSLVDGTANDTPMDFGPFKLKPFMIPQQEGQFDLALEMSYSDEKLMTCFRYCTDIFDTSTAARIGRQYRCLLAHAVENPDRRLWELHLEDSADSVGQILPDPSAPLDEPLQTLVTDMFASWVSKTPERPAVIKGDQILTYEELSVRVQLLARTLRVHGIERGDVVAVFGPRSFGLIVSMMAVFLNGNVLLPIDGNLPLERQQLMIREAGARFLLYVRSRGPEEEPLEQNPPFDVRCMDIDPQGVAQAPVGFEVEAVSLPELSIEDAAYIIFTSGTTGVPKGILGIHKGLSHFLNWQRETFDITPEDRVAQFTNLSFDPVLREIFLPLTSGATLCLPEDLDVINSNDVLSWLERERISVLHAVPTLAHSWLTTTTLELPLAAIRLVFFAGEPLTEDLVRKWRSAFPGAEIVNLYGPTETTLAKCFYRVKSDDVHHGVQPLGSPLPQTQVLVLSRENQLCGIGEPGEIVLRTPFRSLGYVNNEEENRKRFIKNPFRDDETDLVYFTGDRGCYRPDGILEFLGRVDDQVKIRGVRVEPNEIALILAEHPAVDSCFVTSWQDEQNWAYLAAYVVVVKQSGATVSDLTTYLKQRLPAAMVPEAFVFLDVLPVTPRGKIDRRALPSPDRSRPDLEEVFVAPRTQSEELVAGIWCNVLGRERIGVRDNFFELGGHSLLVMQIISRVRDIFQVDLPLRVIFESPTVAGLTEHIETARRSDEGLLAPPLMAVSRDQDLPLSFAQQRLWFLHQLEPESIAYSMPNSVRLKGVLSKDALEKTFLEMARRHETLRTTFHTTDGNPVLRIAPGPRNSLNSIDLRHLPDVEREAEAKRLAEEDAQEPFDLSRGPLFRILLFQLEDQEHVVHFNIHHIISDYWSFGVMSREFAALYTSFVRGESSGLSELPIQYADYAVWQRQWLKGEALEAQLSYWKNKLDGKLPVLELPTDRPRPPVRTYRGEQHVFDLRLGHLEKIRNLSRQRGVTLFMTLLASFKVLLHRYTGQTDFGVGSPIANRNRAELEGLIGFFVNTLVLRTDMSGNPSFVELLGRVRETTLGAYDHQELPFEKLVEVLNPTRDMSYSPLFQVMFVSLNMPISAVELPGVRLSAVAVNSGASKFDLTLFMWEEEGGLSARVEYNTDLFDAQTIERMVGHFEVLLESVTIDPTRRISELPLLTEAERHKLLVEWNATETEYPVDKTVVHLFEEQVERSPDAVAVICKGANLTYAELNRKTNQLASYLRNLGVGPDVLVGLCMERSVDMVIGLLGILKAGGAYVPLDPRFPKDRLEFMLEDSGAPVLITQLSLSGDLSGYQGERICIDSDWERIAQESPENQAAVGTAEDLAYVIYTSGSTGKPKGVQIPHRALVNFLCSMQREPGLSSADTVLSVTTISFDIFGLELFLPLITGAKMVLVERDDAADGARLIKLLKESEASVMQATPATWRLLLQAGWEGNRLLKILCGGEALPRDLVAPLLERGKEFWNLYGPTETTIWSTVYRVRSKEDPILIGSPIANTQIYILDHSLQPTPVGVVGELHIGGEGLARGYLNRPELTAKKFIRHPFNADLKARLYKTGDLARYLADGTIECLGRIDHQVKLRGHRIELGEIEATLAKSDEVNQCAVAVREDQPGDQRLVAYYVAKGDGEVSTSDWRNYLHTQLPDYMVPQHFVKLESMPLTPNGKVDRKALPKPEIGTVSGKEYVAPRTDIERTIAQIWKEVLKQEQVGVHDDFFELGGHSLLATQLISRIDSAFNIELSLRSLFETPTVSSLAEAIARRRTEQAGSETLAQVLAELEPLSPDEVKALLAFDRQKEENQDD